MPSQVAGGFPDAVASQASQVIYDIQAAVAYPTVIIPFGFLWGRMFLGLSPTNLHL